MSRAAAKAASTPGSPVGSSETSCVKRSDPAGVGGASVTFEPGPRTAWHTHPLGQNRWSPGHLALREPCRGQP